MPSDRPDINKRYIKIEDFTLGIHSTYWSATSQRTTFKKNGAATIENTSGCVANPDGVLGPLPGLTEFKIVTNLWAGTATLRGDLIRITDLVCTGPVTSVSTMGPSERESGAFVSVGFSMALTPATGSLGAYELVWRYYNDPITSVGIADQLIYLQRYSSAPTTIPRPGIVLGEGRSDITTVGAPPPPAITSAVSKIVLSASGGSRFYTETARDSGPLSALDQIAFPNYYVETRQQYAATASDNISDINGSLWVYPGKLTVDIYPASVSRPFHWSGEAGFGLGLRATAFSDFVSHQGRVVGIVFLGSFGNSQNTIFRLAGTGIATWQDSLLGYTPYPDYKVFNASPNVLNANPENTSGYGAIGSINASQLLCIKYSGGGVLIQGDLDNPTISQLPYLESTYGKLAHGITTPIGFVYGSKNGVFVWTGGETSDKLSQQIDGLFWDTWSGLNWGTDANADVYGISARFAYWHPYVVVPNNYLFDTRSGGWWRLEAEDTTLRRLQYAYADVDPSNSDLLVAPWALNRSISPTSSIAVAKYQVDTFRSSYSWQSQPLLETELVLDEYDELVLIAQRQNTTGTATITVTLTGFNEDGSAITPAITVFTLAANTQIQMIRQDISVGGSGLPFVGKGLQYRIEVSNTASAAAALVHDVWLGISTQHGEHPLVSS